MIPFIDLRAQYHNIKDEIDEAIAKALENSAFVLGSEVEAFEEEFASYCGANQGIGINSGTSALHLALLVAGVGSGDEVITVPFTFVATVAAIYYTGAKPVYVDIEPRSFTMNTEDLEKVVTKNTKAIIPVHLYGQPADMDPILEFAEKHDLVVIEDAAQAHGSEYKGRRVGGIGHMGCFSFYPSKNLGAYGEGGIVVTSNSDYTRTIKMLRDCGQERKLHHDIRGYNYRMEGFQGAILRVKLKHLDDWTEARRSHAAKYNELLSQTIVKTPQEMSYSKHVYHVYVVRTKERDALRKELATQDIHTGIHYLIPAHLHKAYTEPGYPPGSLPCSESAAAEVISLPMYPEMSQSDIGQVAECIKGWKING